MSKFSWAEFVERHVHGKAYERSAVILLSGGMDSTACLMMAKGRYGNLMALLVDYGQPHRDRELAAAGRLAETQGVQYDSITVADALAALRPHRMAIPAHVPSATPGAHPATVPGRNLILLSIAASFGAVRFPEGPIDVWFGSCADDHDGMLSGPVQRGFVDCRPVFLVQATVALTAAHGRPVSVVTPLDRMRKRDYMMLAAHEPEVLAALRGSWSCYRGGKEPCGECTPCVLRAEAFAVAGVADDCRAIPMMGGDPARDAALGANTSVAK